MEEIGLARLNRALGITLVALAVSVVLFALPTHADEGDGASLEFLSAQEQLSYGPPLPPSITVQLAVSSKITETQTVDVTLQVANITSSNGEPKAVREFVLDYPPGGYRTTVPTPSPAQVVPFTIHLNQATRLDWDTYTGILIAQVGGKTPVTKPISLVVGPQTPPVILSPEIVITATGCPEFLNRLNQFWRRKLSFLCPGHLKQVLNVQTGVLGPRSWFQVQIENEGDIIGLEGFDEHYFGTASGYAVSKEGAGRLILRLDTEAYRKVCPEGLCPNVKGFRVRIQGSSNSGRYEGTFVLDPSNTAGDAAEIDVLVLVRDHWLVPLIFIILGVSTSLGLTWYFDGWLKESRKEKKKTDTEEAQAKLLTRLEAFLKQDKPYMQDRYYRTHPDIVYEAHSLVAKKGQSDADGRLEQVLALFDRFEDAFLRMYHAHQWCTGAKVTPKNSDAGMICHQRMVEIRSGLTCAKSSLWTADSELTMEKAEDHLIRTLLKVDELPEKCFVDKDLPLPVLDFSGARKPEPSGDDDGAQGKSFLARLLERVKRQWHDRHQMVNSERLTERVSRKWEDMCQMMNSVWRRVTEGSLLWNFVRVFIIVLSGFFVVYLSNPTFGSLKDYVWAFLWGSTTDAAIKAAASIFGSERGVVAAFSGLLKR